MNADALPIPVLIVLALSAWGVYLMVVAHELKWNRPNDLDARVARGHVSAQSVEHGEVDDRVQREQPEAGADDPANDESERRGIHGGIVHRPSIYLPPGIPSVTERLDRWEEIS